MCTSIINFGVRNQALLLSTLLIKVVTVCATDQGAERDSEFSSPTSLLPTNGTTEVWPSTTTSTTPINDPLSMWQISTGKMITLLLISFSIPLAFMLLLFWRLQREKKYMKARGALVYRDTVLVPSYTVSDANASVNNENVIQMHSALYDTPPDYEQIVNSSEHNVPVTNGTTGSKQGKTEELPPPSYSTVYM